MRSKGILIVTERDRKIFQFIFERRVATLDQIHRKFFSSAKIQTVHDRLSRLVKENYLLKMAVDYKGRLTAVFGISPSALKAFANQYRYAITKPLLKSDSISHDLALSEVRERLERAEMVAEYLSENMLHACAALTEAKKLGPFVRANSDAALVLRARTDRFIVALEYEVSEKEISRYAKKITEYYLSPEVDGVFYVCGNNRIENVVRQIDTEVGQKFQSKIYTCQEKTIHSGTLPLPFRDRDNAIFSLK